MEIPLVGAMEMRFESPMLKLAATILFGALGLSVAGLMFVVMLLAVA